MNYDPNTSQGRKNCDKYFVTQQDATDLEQQLAKLKRDFETLIAQDNAKIT